jgi:hypothetical protein
MICDDAIVSVSHTELLATVRPHGRPRGARDLIVAVGTSATEAAGGFG